jgi:hypothetical protein
MRSNKMIGKRHTKLFLQVLKIEDSEKWNSKRIHSYTVQFLCMQGECDNVSLRNRIM